jgi:hypothetical protein
VTGPVERLPWAEFLTRFRWEQGEHVSMIGPTGSGKTTLALGILDRRQYVCALGTKPEDKTLDKLVHADGWQKIRAWDDKRPIISGQAQRVVLWPRFREVGDEANQRYQLDRAMRAMFREGRWCLFADELYYLADKLKMRSLLETYWTQGRSVGLSLVGGTQRPAGIPLHAYSSATHLFFWRDNDEVNLKRMGGLGALNSKAIRGLVASLPRHDTLYVNTRDDTLLITRAER